VRRVLILLPAIAIVPVEDVALAVQVARLRSVITARTFGTAKLNVTVGSIRLVGELGLGR
jgi:hypothetical protein